MLIARFLKFAGVAAVASVSLMLANAPSVVAQEVDLGLVDDKGNSYVGNLAAGEEVFVKCQQCHRLAEGDNFTGPSMHGIIGRTAGTVEGFSYSRANRESGIVWTPQQMFDYLESPRRTIRRTTMSFVGLPKEQDRADVLAFLAVNAGGPWVDENKPDLNDMKQPD
jgi:cytochrome c